MDEDISREEKTSTLAFVPALGLLGLCLAIIAIALGIFAMVKVSNTSAAMNDKIEKAAALAIDMKKASDRIDSLALQIEGFKSGDNSRVDSLAKQTQNAVESISKILNENRDAIEVNRKAIEEIAKRASTKSPRASAPAGQTQSPSVAAEAGATATDSSSATAADGDKKTHKIQSGDTFAKLAVKYKVSIDSIVKANPNLNPSRLKIGQEVLIP